MACQWCHNPETQSFEREIRFFSSRCVACGRCVKACQKHAFSETGEGIFFDRSKCIQCGRCVQVCPSGALETIGIQYDVKTLVKKLAQDQIFYEESDGGVTLSGGEVMSVPEKYLLALVKGLYDEGISVNIDTCGFCSWERFAAILPYVDTFLYDVKVLEPAEHRRWTGVENGEILENLKRLASAGARIWVRIPVITSVNGDVTFAEAVGRWLQENHVHPQQINLIKYHDYGSDKYEQLGLTYGGEQFAAPSDEELESMQETLENMGFVVHIGG